MYGTIAKFQVLPGKREEMIRVMAEDAAVALGGWVADYVYQLDRDSDEFYLVAFFKDKPAYDANANSPGQHQRYLKWRALLARDPEWNDGTVILANGPKAHR